MTKHKNNKGNTVRNIPGFIKSYLGSDSGQAALNRKPTRYRNEQGVLVNVWRTNDMALAFQAAIA